MKMRQAAIVWVIIEFLGVFNDVSGIGVHTLGGLFGILYAMNFKRKVYEPQIEYYEPNYNEPSNF